jgi:hypothetical protein
MGKPGIMSPEEILASARATVKTDEEIVAIAMAAARAAIKELLLALGVDASEPHQVIEMQRDFAHLRAFRQSMELVKNRGLATAVAVVVTGGLGLLVMLFRH